MPSRWWKTFTLGCASASGSPGPVQKVRFGVPLTKAFRDGTIPGPLVDLLVYISREGVTVRHIFRRSGNNADVKKLMKRLAEGKPTCFAEYSFYTLASVVKKFLLGIPGGIFGIEAEEKLLLTLQLSNHFSRFDCVSSVVSSLPRPVQRFVVLLFGIWFRIVNHSEFHGMSPEAMAKSVTGCIFRNSSENPTKVKSAAMVMEMLIDEFAMPSMFGGENIQYFADTTCSGILVQEQVTFEYSHSLASGATPRDKFSQLHASRLQQEVESRGLQLENVTATGGGGEMGSEGGYSVGRKAKSHSQLLLDGNGTCSTDSASAMPSMACFLTPGAVIPSQLKEQTKLPTLCSSAPNVNCQAMQSPASSCGPVRRAHAATPPDGGQYLAKSWNRFDTVRSRQIARLQKRSHWFLTSEAAAASSSNCNSVTSRATSSLSHWCGAEEVACDAADTAGQVGDRTTLASSDGAESVFIDLDVNDCCGGPPVETGNHGSDCKPSMPGTTTRRYVRATFYGPNASTKAS